MSLNKKKGRRENICKIMQYYVKMSIVNLYIYRSQLGYIEREIFFIWYGYY